MQTYNYTTINDTGTTSATTVAVNLGGEIVGYGINFSTRLVDTGFLYDDGTLTPIVPPGAVSSAPYGINLAGVIVGSYSANFSSYGVSDSYGFIDDHGQYTTLMDPDGNFTIATGINAFGTVTGDYHVSNGPTFGFVYDHGAYTTISVPGASLTNTYSINDFGEVAGHANLSSGITTDYIYDHGTYTDIIPPGGYASGSNVAINDRGELVGTYSIYNGVSETYRDSTMGFIYDHGTYTTLAVPNATSTTADGVNNLGAVIGTYTTSSSEHGFVYANGTFTNIDISGAIMTHPVAINDLGQIVGYYSDSSGSHGFVATPQGDGKTCSLSDLTGDVSKFQTGLTSEASARSWTHPTGTTHDLGTNNSAACNHLIPAV